MYTISKMFEFSAAHQLFGLPQGHKCGNLHGHNYIIKVVLKSEELNEHGFVVDYGDLAPIKRYIDENLDHKNLNDVLGFQTSAENIAKFLYSKFKEMFPQLTEVHVSETAKTWAVYTE